MASDRDTLDIKENMAAVLHGKLDLRIENIPVPEIGENDVLLRMSKVAICGSDIKYWTHGYCSGVFVLKAPMILGDRVAIEPGIPCKQCRLCKEGSYNLCPEMKFCATPPVHGNLCQYFAHSAEFCYKLPDSVSDEEGSLMEPLSCAIYACSRGQVKGGSTVLVCGAGALGLLNMWMAKNNGAKTVVMTDIDDFRLTFAKEHGADGTINIAGLDELQAAQRITELLGCQPDVTIECSGADFSIRLGIHVTHPGGCIVQVGRGNPEPSIPLNLAASKQVDIRGVFRYAKCYPQALKFIVSGQLPHLKKLATHHFPLADAEKAFQFALSRDERSLRVVIDCI